MLPTSSSTRGSGTTPLVALLLCALAVTGVLAYQAQDAARSHRESAERALREYASLAAWQFGRHADMTLTALQMMSFRMAVVEVEGAPRTDPLPSPGAFRTQAMRQTEWCACLDSTVTAFRLDLRDGTIATTDDAPLATGPWLQEMVGAHVRQSRTPTPERVEFGRAPLRPDRSVPYVFRSRDATVVFGTLGGAPRAVLYYLAHDADARPLAVYGFEADPAALVGPAFRRILQETPLLPQSLTGDLPNDSVIAIAIHDRDGNEIYRSGPFASAYAATDTLDGAFEDLVVRASIRPGIAGDLIIGGLPRSRLPLLLALLGLTAALIVVALVQMRRQHELARLRSDFVAGVSHELRTPLAQIRLFAELLRSGRLAEEDRDRSARVIDQEAQRLSHLVENVLQFSRTERDGLRIRSEPREIAPLIEETIDTFRPLAVASRAEIDADLAPGIIADVDPAALRQMLLNLLDNAVKYGPADQRITVELRREDGRAQIRVSDQGPGVPPEDRERIWKPYRRLDGAVESGAGGSGIGLSLVRELAVLHGGGAWVDDPPTGGRFVIELPLAERAAQTRPTLETA